MDRHECHGRGGGQALRPAVARNEEPSNRRSQDRSGRDIARKVDAVVHAVERDESRGRVGDRRKHPSLRTHCDHGRDRERLRRVA